MTRPSVNVQRFMDKRCARCWAPLRIDSRDWLCEKCKPVTCPIRFDAEADSKEIVAQKWKEIKQWYADHPEAQDPWDEYEEKCRQLMYG